MAPKAELEKSRDTVFVPETTNSPDGLDGVRAIAYGSTPKFGQFVRERSGNIPGVVAGGSDGFQLTDSPVTAKTTTPPENAKIEVLPNLQKKFDANYVAGEIEAACNKGGLLGAGTDIPRILGALRGLSPEQIAQADQKFADTFGKKYAKEGQRWGFREEFRDEMSGTELKLAESILSAKNEIPANLRVNGSETLKDGSGLKAGETNRVTYADGRQYDVYIPANAQKPLPVVVMLHGASNGHDPANMRLLEKESGMNHVAEQYGFAVVYAFAQPQDKEAIFGIDRQPANWNLKDRKNMLDTNPAYDDAVYLDRVIADVGNRVTVDDTRIGIAGMSDGGRAAQQYALDRPGKISGLSIMHGTWMNGERMPEAGTGAPIMFVHGTKDYMLPHDQGEKVFLPDPGVEVEQGRGFMAWLASSFTPNTTESRPGQQIGVWKEANDCEGNATIKTVDGVKITEYSAQQCKTGEVKHYLIEGANHAWQDWRNEGGWYVVGMPDRTQRFSEETAKFILSHKIQRDLK